jgi:hypothetical protein
MAILAVVMGLGAAAPGFAATRPVITEVLPPYGAAVGQIVTIKGSGFLLNTGPNYQTSNNQIYFPSDKSSPAKPVKTIPPGYIFYVGTHAIKFTMPPEVEVAATAPAGGAPGVKTLKEKLIPGTYLMSVGNVHGRSNEVAFSYNETPAIGRIFPDSGTVGTEITIEGVGFTATDNWIGFPSHKGMAGAPHTYIPGIPSPDGKHLRFTIPAEIQVSYLDYSGGGRPVLRQKTEKPRAGTLKISVGNRNGESNLLPFTFYR